MLFLGVAPAIFGTKILSFSKFIPDGEFHLLGTTLTYNGALNIFIGLLLMAIIFAFLQYTKYGLAVRTTASNEVVSRLMGIPTKVITMGSWATAAALGTLAALMVAPLVGVHTSMMDTVQISAFLAVVLGGLQTFYGPVIGAYLIAIGSNFAIYYINDKWGLQIVYLFIILILYIKPVGLFGKKRVKKV
jgi:branched-chain amino acid transport system permease protein